MNSEYLFVIKYVNLQNTKTLALICNLNLNKWYSQLNMKKEVYIIFDTIWVHTNK